jgi:hypothetical protein
MDLKSRNNELKAVNNKILEKGVLQSMLLYYLINPYPTNVENRVSSK